MATEAAAPAETAVAATAAAMEVSSPRHRQQVVS